jgi:hypothetical protein
MHTCPPGQRRPLHDARGIFCCYVCDRCEDEKRSRYRVEVMTDPNYEASEDIDGDQ